MSTTKSDLIELLSTRARLPRATAERVIDILFDSMVDAMKRGERIEIRGFGSFEVRQYKAYQGRNPRTGEAVEVPPKKLPFFKVGKELRERVDRGVPEGGEESGDRDGSDIDDDESEDRGRSSFLDDVGASQGDSDVR